MRRFKLIVLLAVLFLGACQKFDACTPKESAGTDGKRAILWTQKQVEGVASRAVAETDKLWEAGDTIRIKFQNGSLALQDQVKQYAVEWLTYANLVFLYVDASEDADVKIGFDMDERWLAWSAIGTDCQSVPQDSVSLNFVWLEDEGAAGVKAEVLRGFGHVLGLGFEHKNPGSNVQFKSRETVAEEYNLSEADVEELITLYSTDRTNFTEYDKSSIMTIAIPRSLVTKPIYATSRNSELSELDKEFVAGLYPYELPVVTMVTGKQSVRFSIHKLQEIDVDWGDGMRETLVMSGYDGPNHIFEVYNPPVYVNVVEHVYEDSEVHTIRFFGSDTTLTLLIGTGNELTTLELGTNRELVYLECELNSIPILDVSKCPKLKELSCGHNQLSILDVSKNPLLFSIHVSDNPLVTMEMKNNPNLENIGAGGCRLSVLDLSNVPNLYSLGISDNMISYLDLSHNPKLSNLTLFNNRLASLNLSCNPEVGYIDISNNPLQDNDVELLNLANSLPVKSSMLPGTLTLSKQYAKDLIQIVCNSKNWYITLRNS